MEKLGDTFYASQKFKDAAPVYRRLVGIREKSLGANPLTLSALFKMAKVHERLGQSDEAEEHYKRGVALGERVPGPLYANLCDAYSALLKRTNRDQQEALRLEQAAKQRRDRDGISARVGEATLQMAAIQIPAAESLGADADQDDYEEEDETEDEPEQAEADLHEAPAAGAFSAADLDAIKSPSVEGAAEPPGTPAKPDILSRTPKSQPGSFLKRKTEESGAPPSPANQFSKGVLDSIGAPEPAAKPFSIADLNSIQLGGAGASSPAAAAQPAAKPTLGATTDATKPSGSTTGGAAFDVSSLDAIKPPSSSSLSKPPAVPAPAAKPDFNAKDLSAIKSPSSSVSGERSPAFEEERKTSRAVTRSELPESSAALAGPAMVPAMVALVLIICCVAVVGFNMMSKSSGPNNVGLTPFAGKTFKTADRKQELFFTGVSKGQFIIKGEGGQKSTYDTQFVAYTGSPLEEFQALTGAFDNDIWLQNHFLGFKSEGGAILYDPSAPEVNVIEEMWNIADAAQLYYKAHGRYPRQPSKDPSLLKQLNPKLSFVNALTKQDLIPEIMMLKWPDSDVPNNVQTQSKLEKQWLEGQPFSKAATLAGTVRCAQIGAPVLDTKLADDWNLPGSQRIDEFFIEGYNRYNELIRGGSGKVFIITLKKGADMTEMTAPPLVPQNAKSPITLVISESERPNRMSVILKYLGMIAFFAVVILVWLKWPTIVAKVRREDSPS